MSQNSVLEPNKSSFQSRHTQLIMIGLLVFVCLFIGIIIGILLLRGPYSELSNITTLNNTEVHKATDVVINLPVDPKSRMVSSSGLVYSISGRIKSIAESGVLDRGTHVVELYDTSGVALENEFYIDSNNIQITSISLSNPEEVPADFSELKKDTPVQFSYYVNLKYNSPGKVTKIIIEKY